MDGTGQHSCICFFISFFLFLLACYGRPVFSRNVRVSVSCYDIIAGRVGLAGLVVLLPSSSCTVPYHT